MNVRKLVSPDGRPVPAPFNTARTSGYPCLEALRHRCDQDQVARYRQRVASGIVRFRGEVHEAALEDLRERLRRTRWPDPTTVTDWSQGVPLEYLRDLC